MTQSVLHDQDSETPLFFTPLTEYEYYYYDLPTEVPAEDYDLSLDDWLYELMDVTGKQPLARKQHIGGFMTHKCKIDRDILPSSWFIQMSVIQTHVRTEAPVTPLPMAALCVCAPSVTQEKGVRQVRKRNS